MSHSIVNAKATDVNKFVRLTLQKFCIYLFEDKYTEDFIKDLDILQNIILYSDKHKMPYSWDEIKVVYHTLLIKFDPMLALHVPGYKYQLNYPFNKKGTNSYNVELLTESFYSNERRINFLKWFRYSIWEGKLKIY